MLNNVKLKQLFCNIFRDLQDYHAFAHLLTAHLADEVSDWKFHKDVRVWNLRFEMREGRVYKFGSISWGRFTHLRRNSENQPSHFWGTKVWCVLWDSAGAQGRREGHRRDRVCRICGLRISLANSPIWNNIDMQCSSSISCADSGAIKWLDASKSDFMPK